MAALSLSIDHVAGHAPGAAVVGMGAGGGGPEPLDHAQTGDAGGGGGGDGASGTVTGKRRVEEPEMGTRKSAKIVMSEESPGK